jgi:hypothetical protein
MNIDREFKQLFRQEFQDMLPNLIWQDTAGTYEVFDKYQIESLKPGFRVSIHGHEIGVFNSSKTAVSWCIADKFRQLNLARDLLTLDQKLGNITNDISVRAAIADRSTRWEFRDPVGVKLETKIIRKKLLENQLSKCVDSAKYLQQRGFNNETARTGRSQPNKTSR